MASFLADHLENFKGCEHHDRPPPESPDVISLQGFVDLRRQLYNPDNGQQLYPDFARDAYLPQQARSDYLPDQDLRDDPEWFSPWDDSTRSKEPFHHMSRTDWQRHYSTFEEILTGGENPPKLDVRLDDQSSMHFTPRPKVTHDFDSVLAFIPSLASIKTVLRLSLTSNPARNFKASLHLAHRGRPLHHIPHFFLGSFGHDPPFNLFLFLPNLFRNVKRTRRHLHNHVPEHLRRDFMDLCLLPALRKTLSSKERQSLPSYYYAAKAKSQASAVEGNRYANTKRTMQEISFDLDPRHFDKVWRLCVESLNNKISEAEAEERSESEEDSSGIDGANMLAFKGFQLFVDSKGHKDRVSSSSFYQLASVFKKKVLSRLHEIL